MSKKTTATPTPLVPADVDLTGLPAFLLNVERLLASELVALATPEEGWAAFMLWCRSFQQRPPGSLPNDDRVLAAYSKAGPRWPEVKEMALRGFVLCSDGRLYHRTMAKVVNDAWASRVERRESSGNRNGRQQRWRERVRAVSAALRALGITPPGGATLAVLEAMLRNAENPSSNPDGVDVDVYRYDYVDASEIAKKGSGSEVEENASSLRSEGATSASPQGHAHAPKTTNGSRLSSSWQPSNNEFEFAREQGFDGHQLQNLADSFRDYWLAKPGPAGRKADWSATWRNWVRRERDSGSTVPYSQRPSPAASRQRRSDPTIAAMRDFVAQGNPQSRGLPRSERRNPRMAAIERFMADGQD